MNKRTFDYLSREPAVPCPSGDRYKKKNILIKKGDNLSLKEVGRIDIQEQIQSHHDGVSLQKMIERFNRSGDPGVFSRGSGFYADVSGYSTDMQEVINGIRDVIPEMENLSAAAGKDPVDQSSSDVLNSENNTESEVNTNA